MGCFVCAPTLAAGMQPETTVVIFYEEDGQASINLTNTDAGPTLLHSKVEHIPEDPELSVIVTQPVVRVDAGQTQLIRLVGSFKEPLKTQRYKRVTFEGIPQKKTEGGATVGINIRHNLPLIIHPKGLPRHQAPWQLLKWTVADGHLAVQNDSPYVVRLSERVQLNPASTWVALPRTYVLPGETLTAELQEPASAVKSVTIQPATLYGFAIGNFDAPVVNQ
ncbi:fimbria/pilus chaperone family protein [Pseudomonas sp. K18]|uniref:Fimbria/pilus chaperone family protein n=1 Tax=Pseudomonas citrulli TaxID=3064347 RepID=A0ABT9BUS5_9PSED|nr:fimbria/pilus chaperone family protein [Pseudomonas sp. K18]MDO7895689.1 fimbria/pilus chaperone family protein [Pseudomonas sp. K18]